MVDYLILSTVIAGGILGVAVGISPYRGKNEILSKIGVKEYNLFEEALKLLEYKLSSKNRRLKLINKDPLLNFLYG